ncbi:helicase [Arsenicicoccus piscis]|uniref:HelD family protein n=1 Tax=Arsenicicoccus piscis TaxID=673954 RepID=UPI001F4CB164|nr:helicase [Arsenicicoccus piscis]MCH8626262.1 helicase [Arsenicicoccus piscis]
MDQPQTNQTPQAQAPAGDDVVAQQVAIEQRHVDRVYAELVKAAERNRLLESEGMGRGRTDRVGDVRDEEAAALFERDALMFSAARRRASLESQHEGLVFGRLDLDHSGTDGQGGEQDREVRYVGRLGVRDDDYEPLVIDWRAPAAAPFYQATPLDPQSVLRRRVLRSRDAAVVGVEDDLMVPEAPDDLVVVGDGALMAALTRSRGAQMRDIVATIQRHQDEAIRAAARGVTEITGGPGTGKTVVALHRAAYLLYSNRRRFESGGILVVGPSSAYTAYIERVLPSLGEDSVALRALGDLVDGVTAARVDRPETAALKGSLRIRRLLGNVARGRIPGAPSEFRAMVAGLPVRLEARTLDRIRSSVLRHHQRNGAAAAARTALAEVAWSQVGGGGGNSTGVEREEFLERFEDHLDVEAFMREWWRPVDPREVLLWLTDRSLLDRHSHGAFSPEERELLASSYDEAIATGTWSVADVALIDDLAARLGVVVEPASEDQGFYEIDELGSPEDFGVQEVYVGGVRRTLSTSAARITPGTGRERLLAGRIEPPSEYAHVLVDEAQDLSPMQWRALGRRGRYASWTVVGDAAQSSLADPDESAQARSEAFGPKERRHFHMTTNYRNAREIFDYAADVIRRAVPDADIPDAVRETGVEPVELTVAPDALAQSVLDAARELREQVDGLVTVIVPASHADLARSVAALDDPRITAIDPLSTKGLEYDATVVVDPDAIVADTAGGIRTLYVVLTRAAHRMTVVTPRLP